MTRALFITLAVLLLFGDAGATHQGDETRAFLETSFNLTNVDFDRIDQGQVVSRTLDVSDQREVATLGVVRMAITPEFYVQQLADIATFKQAEAVLQIGAFGNPPDLHDVDRLTLDDSDIRSLRACRVGRCGVQLSAHAIGRFRQEVDWGRADAEQRATDLMRKILVEYVGDYLKAGAAASMEYADQAERVDMGREFVSLAESGMGGWQQFPALRRHLEEYPEADARGTTDLVYWSKENVGRRAVTSVTHLAISRTAGESPADYAIASKQIYGTHYYDASLGLTVLVRDHSGPSPAMYLAYMNRSRIDIFGGMFGGLARKIVSSRARATVSDQLTRLRRTIEHQFAAR